MRANIMLFGILLTIAGCKNQQGPDSDTFQPAYNFLTAGNSSAGRQAFSTLKCGACHSVAGDADFRNAHLQGPELGSIQSLMSADELADAIFAPSHTISPEMRTNTAPDMGDYSNVMTVRQFVDLIAFIKVLPWKQ